MDVDLRHKLNPKGERVVRTHSVLRDVKPRRGADGVAAVSCRCRARPWTGISARCEQWR